MNNLKPTFPAFCVACDNIHRGNLDAAITDGWHFSVYKTRTLGNIEFAGCPNHFKEWNAKCLVFVKSMTK